MPSMVGRVGCEANPSRHTSAARSIPARDTRVGEVEGRAEAEAAGEGCCGPPAAAEDEDEDEEEPGRRPSAPGLRAEVEDTWAAVGEPGPAVVGDAAPAAAEEAAAGVSPSAADAAADRVAARPWLKMTVQS